MNLKKIILLITLYLSFTIFSFGENTPGTITVASWNIRILSDKSRDENELKIIADILSRYDLVAIQEVRDKIVMDRLIKYLPEYDYIISEPVGNKVKERYAYLYRSQLIEVLGSYIFPDNQNQFIREPFVAHFKSDNFDFTLISIHVLFGKKPDRRKEISLLDNVLISVDESNGPENDTILLGDFNFSKSESSWEIITHKAMIEHEIKTTIKDSSSYDNIWINLESTTEYISLYEMYNFDEILFNNDDKLASLNVSDHRPISFIFNTTIDDDSPGNWKSLSEVKTLPKENIITNQCIAVTKKGNQCSRSAEQGSSYCWQHK